MNIEMVVLKTAMPDEVPAIECTICETIINWDLEGVTLDKAVEIAKEHTCNDGFITVRQLMVLATEHHMEKHHMEKHDK